MPTPTGKPKVGEYIVWPDGSRRRVLRREDGGSWSVLLAPAPGDLPQHDRWLTEAGWWIDRLGLQIEGGDVTPAMKRTRRFSLDHLTPGARALFQAYREALKLHADAVERAQREKRIFENYRRPIVEAQRKDEPVLRASKRRMLNAAMRHTRLCHEADKAKDVVDATFLAAVVPMENEGYPRAWWQKDGQMRIPEGHWSRGANRLRSQGRAYPHP